MEMVIFVTLAGIAQYWLKNPVNIFVYRLFLASYGAPHTSLICRARRIRLVTATLRLFGKPRAMTSTGYADSL